ncbi:MAG: M18 family aminopeptidase [Clostridia bacterium]|nr:M18 family aminopeptidase [Clostridia bacterium]
MKNPQSLFDFIKSSPTPHHTVNEIKARLVSSGYTELNERDVAAFSDGGKHFTVRADSSIIAFHGKGRAVTCAATHCDTPTLKIKSDIASGAYIRLDVEKYGGPILYSWLDRPLSVAGIVAVDQGSGIELRLVNIDRDIAVIPSVAIHQQRSVNDGFSPSISVDMPPLVALSEGKSLLTLIAEELDVCVVNILSHDLYVYARDCGRVIGTSGELMLSPRLDNLECTYAALRGFLSAEDSDSVSVLAVFNNEEIGSSTRQGADSTFLSDTLAKIFPTPEALSEALENGFMLSMDNAHAVHPNHPELSDKNGCPALGSGVVLKLNANGRYATDAASAAIARKLASRASAKIATYYCHADKPCGSTLGAIATTGVPLLTADVGLPQLAMHSAVETAAVSDLNDMIAIARELFSSKIYKTEQGYGIAKK